MGPILRERLAHWRASRDSGRAAELMAQLEGVARGSDNIMPVLIACVEGGVTVGEIGRDALVYAAARRPVEILRRHDPDRYAVRLGHRPDLPHALARRAIHAHFADAARFQRFEDGVDAVDEHG